jgi:hypothetical protein
MQTVVVFEHQMSFRVFDTQFGAQGMENIGEIWYCMVPFLTQGGPSCVLVLVASNRVVFVRDLTPHVGRIIYSDVIKVNINKA